MPSCPGARDQRGFTLVEVMVAIVLLLVGVLGVVALVDGANAVTSKTRAREGGTNVARSIIEVSRSVRYRDLDTATLLAELATRPGLGDADGAAGYTIRSRGVDYELTLTVCSLDDDRDNLGTHPAGVTFCPDTAVLPAGEVSRDRNPDDYKRVRVTLVWSTRATEQSITQTSSIINPVGGLGPSVTGLTMTDPSSASNPFRINVDVPFARFAATTSVSAEQLNWSVNGDVQGQANGGPVNWDFQWDFEDSNGNLVYPDCTYVIQADALDSQGRAGAPRAVTVILNRTEALAPNNFDGGRNGNGDLVDLQWTKNRECDVVGYRVFRTTDPLALTGVTQVTCLGQTLSYVETLDCVDDPPNGLELEPLYYFVRAIDTDASGALREGARSDILAVLPGNARPSVPQNVTSCIGGQPGCNDPDGQPAPSGAIVVRWDPSTDSDGTVDFYRIYRDGTTYAHRWGTFFADPGIAWFEPEPDGTTHTYRVTAVDDDFGESDLSDPVDAG